MSNRFDDNDEGFDFGGEYPYDEEGINYPDDENLNSSDIMFPIGYEKIRQEEMTIVNQKIHSVILKQSIVLLEKSWFWRFKSPSKKLKIIYDTYFALLDLIELEK